MSQKSKNQFRLDELLLEAQKLHSPMQTSLQESVSYLDEESFALVQQRNEAVALFIAQAEELGVDYFTSERIVSEFFRSCELALDEAITEIHQGLGEYTIH